MVRLDHEVEESIFFPRQKDRVFNMTEKTLVTTELQNEDAIEIYIALYDLMSDHDWRAGIPQETNKALMKFVIDLGNSINWKELGLFL